MSRHACETDLLCACCRFPFKSLPVVHPQVGVLPYGEAVVCIANTLVALCLNLSGLQRVKDSRAMDCFVPIFTSKKYSRYVKAITILYCFVYHDTNAGQP